MARILIESAIRAALVAGAARALLQLFGIRTAAARHRAWTAVLVIMLLLPFAGAAGARLPLPVWRSAAASSAVSSVRPIVAEAPAMLRAEPRDVDTITAPARMPSIENAALALYVAGALVFMLRLAYGMQAARTLQRRAVVEDGRLTSPACATPITVGWFTPVVVLPAGWQRWSAAQLAAVLAHEGAHVRRRDPLVQWLALVNLSLFWFHPLAWFLRRRLATLAEEACDAAVLEAGHRAEDYASYLLEFARSMARRGHRLSHVGHAMAGSDLSSRISLLLAGRRPRHASAGRVAGAVICGAAATVVFAAVVPVPSVQDRTIAADNLPRFDVVSVKPNNSGSGKLDFNAAPGRRLVGTNVSVKMLITEAYHLQDFQLVGAPDWIANARFDIDAVAPAGTPDQMFVRARPGEPSPGELLVRSLLIDRFKLDAGLETRELPVFALVLDRKDGSLGPGLKRSTLDCASLDKLDRRDPPAGMSIKDAIMARCEMLNFPGALVSGGASIADLGGYLAPLLNRIVVDRTGLAGAYAFELRWTPENFAPAMNRKAEAIGLSDVDENGPSLPRALQEQLGLRLDGQKGPVPVLVIKSISRPTPN